MKVTLLGTGCPILEAHRHGSAILIEIGPDRLLFDAGRGATMQLFHASVPPQEINPIFITHHHLDHIGNLGEVIMTAWHQGRHTPLPIFGPHGTANIVAALLNQVYKRDIEFALFIDPHGADIRELVTVTEVEPGLVYETEQYKVLTEYVNHGHGLGMTQESWPCLGYRVEAEGKVFAFSGDAVACPGLERLAHQADLLIQCCYVAEAEISNPTFAHLTQHVIASAGQVGQIATQARVKKMVLTHFRPKSQAMMANLTADVRQNYNGELILGEDLMVIEL